MIDELIDPNIFDLTQNNDKLSENQITSDELTKAENSEAVDLNAEKDSVIETVNEYNEILNPKLDELKVLIDSHYEKIKKMLIYNKEKDRNLSNMNDRFEKYKKRFGENSFTNMALNIIIFRETLKNILRNFEGQLLSVEECAKQINYINEEIEELLSNLGIMYKDDKWLFNGKDIDANVEYIDCDTDFDFETIQKVEIEELPKTQINSYEDLLAYFNCADELIVSSINNNKITDKLISNLIESGKNYDEGLYQVMLYPFVRSLINELVTKRNYEKDIAELKPESCTINFLIGVQEIINNLSDLLYRCRVTIDACDFEGYDPKRQEVVKRIKPSNDELDGKIERRISDCYILNDKVIYTQKIVIYRK